MSNIVRFKDAKELEGEILKRDQLIRDIAPAYMTPVRLARILNIAFTRTPKLRECTKTSILFAGIEAALVGLEPSGVWGDGWLVPFRNRKSGAMEAQFIPGYRGLAKLAVWSNSARSIKPVGVYENDEWDFDEATEAMVHKWPKSGERGRLVRVYASIVLPDGSRRYDVMTMEEVEKIRSRSRAKDAGPWVDWYDEMAKARPVRRACKTLPVSGPNPWRDRLDHIVAKDAEVESGEADDLIPQEEEAIDAALVETAQRLGPRPDAPEVPEAPWEKYRGE